MRSAAAEKGKKAVRFRSSGMTAAQVEWAERSGMTGQANMPTRKSSSLAAAQEGVCIENALTDAQAAAATKARMPPSTGTSRTG